MAEPISRARDAKKQPTRPINGCVNGDGNFSNKWVMRRTMCNMTKMNVVVATNIKYSYSTLELIGWDAKIENVRNVIIASKSLSHPSFVVTVHWISQQRLAGGSSVLIVLFSPAMAVCVSKWKIRRRCFAALRGEWEGKSKEKKGQG